MKKALVITYHDAPNYGAVLQGYALKKFLEENGVEVTIRKNDSKIELRFRILNIIKNGFKNTIVSEPEKLKFEESVHQQILGFQKNFKFSHTKEQYDVAILGSDEIWNIMQFGTSHNKCFFSPCPNAERTISYSASCGYTKYNRFKYFRYAVNGIRGLDAIAVRDKNTENLVRKVGRRDYVETVDPIFLTDFDCDYKSRNRLINQLSDYIFVYSYGLSELQVMEIKEFSKERSLPIVVSGYYCTWADYNVSPTPFEWVDMIRKAKYIITSTFHGSAFSIKYNKEFAVYAGNSDKINAILNKFQLTDRKVSEKLTLRQCFENTIDYSTINKILAEEISLSQEYLLFQFNQKTNGKYPKYLENRFFIVRHCDDRVVEKSRSGGVFTALSDNILSKHGVIYGAILNEQNEIVHVRAESKEVRDKMRGSKYTQSNLCEIWDPLKEDLQQGRWVLFTGTPCQVDAVKQYAKYINLSDMLITMDFVCHGVSSPLIFQDYLSAKNYQSKFQYRDKKRFGWASHYESFYGKRWKHYSEELGKLYYTNLITRKSCYQCPYAQMNRFSDITVADCWGVGMIDHRFNKKNDGASMVILNTEKGEDIFLECLPMMNYRVAKKSKENMQQPVMYREGKGAVTQPENRLQFWNDYSTFGLKYILREYRTKEWKNDFMVCMMIPNYITNSAKKIIKRILGLW